MDYSRLLNVAVHDIMREAIKYYSLNSSAGDGTIHIKLSFMVACPGVIIPDHLRESYHDLMPVVLRNRFRNLRAGTDSFSVYLSFQNEELQITIPYASIVDYVDVISGFSLGFQNHRHEGADYETTELLALFKNKKPAITAFTNYTKDTQDTSGISFPKNVVSLRDLVKPKNNN